MHKFPVIRQILGLALLPLTLLAVPTDGISAPAETPSPLPAVSAGEPPVRATTGLSEFPLLFIPNQGQWSPEVEYLVRTDGADLIFGVREVVIGRHDRAAGAGPVRLRPLDASPDMELVPGERLGTRVSHYVGQDPERWRASLPTHASLSYRNVHEGIDLVFRDARGTGNAEGQQLAYDLLVAPGADPSLIRLGLEGVKELRIADDGLMIMTLPDGSEMRQQPPFVYQERNGQRVAVPGRFRILESDPERTTQVFGFELGEYDPGLALVIDPAIVYSTLVGGAKRDEVKAIKARASGTVVVVGKTLSLPGDLLDKFNGTAGGKNDALIYQLGADGKKLEFLFILGGAGDDQINALALGANGSIYLTGQTTSTDFPNVGALYPLLPGGKAQATFVAKLSSDGKALSFCTYFGGSGVDAGNAIALDGDDTIYVGGKTASTDLVLVNPRFGNTLRGASMGFLLKMKPDGSQILLSSYFGGSGEDSINAIAIDDDSYDIYFAGTTKSTDLPGAGAMPGAGSAGGASLQGTNRGGTDAFVARISSAGTDLVFSTYLGGGGED